MNEFYDDNPYSLIEENRQLKDNTAALEMKVTQLNKELRVYLKTDQEYRFLQKDNERLEEEIRSLREKLISKEHEMHFKIIDSEHNYKNEIMRLQQEMLGINHKCDFINSMSSYVHSLEELNEDMSNQIKKMETEHKTSLQVEYERNKIDIEDLRKRTMNILVKSKKALHNRAVDSLSNSNKLTMLQNLHLQSELADQGQLLEEFLTEMDRKDKVIRGLRVDLEIRKELEANLIGHCKKLLKVINEMRGNSNNGNISTVMPLLKSMYVPNATLLETITTTKTGHSFYKMKLQDNNSPPTLQRNVVTHTNTLSNPDTRSVTGVRFYKSKQKNEKHSKNNKKFKTILDDFENQLLKSTKSIFC